ncbi:MAG: EamA family transporter, partial [Deltaproteobacteria bacterium]|nr:EamA family transporter [Deltaproteobacteria bacterium]
AAGTGRFEYLLFPLIAAFCFGINPIFKKIGISAAGLPVLGALVTQSTALLCMLAFGRFMGLKVKRERVPLRGLLFFALSGVTEAIGSLCTFFALIYGPAALLSPIWRISPLVTFALARFTLKGIEVVTLRDGVAASLIVAGVFVLSRG